MTLFLLFFNCGGELYMMVFVSTGHLTSSSAGRRLLHCAPLRFDSSFFSSLRLFITEGGIGWLAFHPQAGSANTGLVDVDTLALSSVLRVLSLVDGTRSEGEHTATLTYTILVEAFKFGLIGVLAHPISIRHTIAVGLSRVGSTVLKGGVGQHAGERYRTRDGPSLRSVATSTLQCVYFGLGLLSLLCGIPRSQCNTTDTLVLQQLFCRISDSLDGHLLTRNSHVASNAHLLVSAIATVVEITRSVLEHTEARALAVVPVSSIVAAVIVLAHTHTVGQARLGPHIAFVHRAVRVLQRFQLQHTWIDYGLHLCTCFGCTQHCL
mmetsp:Transcript_43065/g.111579  ORF Transcript_43065/g.111579 Transcript_43065/m.111579 type:complete len:322 (-) Transcript_43065:2810-3775(-)